MSVSLRVLDDGAWVSVNDAREVSVSELWRLNAPAFCGCELPDFVVENVLSVGADGRTVSAKVYGQCIACGETGVPGWVPVGRLSDGEFTDIARESVVLPVRNDGDIT
ncbi:hypothetical protein E6P09_02090 [Haloferax mediterranei ATCC 33500]|uniref:DUF8134 domain-containing protein n=1 Tax=Haloferax mediterranei (strain ATCC 33500 / DSM 1411 / JCM 8866 / NBRC 14739 / NCIMB 2177 / R-4) TaxID=523841 RepID=I3R5V6_HALMT|nr:hypothetical protein [Haloferax mediterranei]AFK19616.1 hypothetical protein HFX_1919 [Haloferax mediterranei ATCC 33500]AHZ23007.1 hypothetical protein BM92_10315 [Haloferax mediterranei ATCC 33500]ELZ99934.1 hypothetical protein C439_11383 [Haloferax mediterranei ATCC 33500]MDX5987643.1 hypothetical protein [Haloferax mediterranei ATCC 33500]QCQ74129.1 hypothetical protein E6P09_02090 [Haloferax mediterranei ATCC 33500]